MGPPIHRAHADAHVSMLQTERYVSDAQTRWPVVPRQAALAMLTLPLPCLYPARVRHVMRSAEAAAADIFARAMKTPSTEPLAKAGQNSNPRTESAFQVGEVFTFWPDLRKRGHLTIDDIKRVLIKGRPYCRQQVSIAEKGLP